MGGITIDTEGNVLDTKKRRISGLRAAGEVTGGVHGNNRLAGNSLLECTVFGSLVGRNLPLQDRPKPQESGNELAKSKSSDAETRQVSVGDLAQHNTPEDCWVAIHGVVYDLTEFAEEHPAGPDSIHNLAGKDGTEAFATVHNRNILEDFDDDRIGILVS
jgi:succinate dehydrogenase/fumarate reductase flavoprotein subunit